MTHFPIDLISSWDRFHRGHFINSLSGFKPVSLIATVGPDGVSNLGVFSNIVHLGADPALVGFVNRPREAAPHTIRNIEAGRYYTINHIHPDFLDRAHQTSAKYPDGVSEFAAVGLGEEWKAGFPVPFVEGSPVQYALELAEVMPIPLNGTYFVIGRILHVFVDERIVGSDGLIDLYEAGSMVSLGLDAYGTVMPHARFAYAKPDRPAARV
jgi:flavin reductase (DIM6/NTAB) family NADH-FMN oxidoreductase RutF